MNKRKFRPFPLIFLYLFVMLFLYGCASGPKEPVSNNRVTQDVENFLKENISKNVGAISTVIKDISTEDNDGLFVAEVDYTFGDIKYKTEVDLDYSYTRSAGWTLDSIAENSAFVKEASAEKLSIERVCGDLENTRYYSGYSDMIFENKRLKIAKFINQEVDAKTGYIRINLSARLNADSVYEILNIYCEYLLDEDNKFYLSTADVNLSSVEVQNSVSEDMIKEGLQAVSFYRDQEESLWRIGELNKLTYEIISDDLDKKNNSETVELNFRGEGLYMYLSGKCTMTFHFSSGWYLYDSYIDAETVEIGMLSDAWEVDLELLRDSIVNDYKLTYNEVENLAITKDMIDSLEIRERKITDNGKIQTVYFSYKLFVAKTEFDISGYVKYDLADGFLAVSNWYDSIDNVKYSLSDRWTGFDVASDYIAYYELDLTDKQNGTLSGVMRVYAVDYDNDPTKVLSAEIEIIGNIYNGTSFEIMDTNWIFGDISYGFIIPRGFYRFTDDSLIVLNGKFGDFIMSRNDSSTNMMGYLYSLISSGNLKSYIQDQLFKKHHE